jgi:hypothetical protein
MYNQRFKQWKISKYIKFSEKEELLKDCGGSTKELTARYKAGKIKKAQYEKTLRWVRAKQSAEPPSSYILDLSTVGTERILRVMADFHRSLVVSPSGAEKPLSNRYLEVEMPKECNDLWFGIIRGVKSLTMAQDGVHLRTTASRSAMSSEALSTSDETFAILRQVGYLAAPAMDQRPLEFMYELITELTAFQARGWPEVRQVILQLFSKEASRVLGNDHPITVICREMQQDTDDSGVTCRSLDCVRELAMELWGEEHILTFKIQMALYRALLKQRNMKRAAQIGTELLIVSQQMWGPGSQEARLAGHRLGQLYSVTNELAMDKGAPDFAAVDNALKYWHNVITVPSSEATSQPRRVEYYEDEIALTAMGDIAFINNRVGNDTEALIWYQKTAELSRHICDPHSNVTKAAISMLIKKQTEIGRLDQAGAWQAMIDEIEFDLTEGCSSNQTAEPSVPT